MKACCFDTCRSKLRHRRQGISFHEFPSSEEIRKKWVMVVRTARREPRWSPTPGSRVCSLHFSSCQFLSKRVLHARAVPSAKCQLPRFMRGGRRSVEPEPDLIDLDNDIPDASMGFPRDETEEAANDAEALETSAAAAVLVKMASQLGEGPSTPADDKVVVEQMETVEAAADPVQSSDNSVVDLTQSNDNDTILNKELSFAQFIEIPPPAESTAENPETPAENSANSAVVTRNPVVITESLYSFVDNSIASVDSSLARSDISAAFDDFETSSDNAIITVEDLEAFAASSAALLSETSELLNESFDDQLTQPLPE